MLLPYLLLPYLLLPCLFFLLDFFLRRSISSDTSSLLLSATLDSSTDLTSALTSSTGLTSAFTSSTFGGAEALALGAGALALGAGAGAVFLAALTQVALEPNTPLTASQLLVYHVRSLHKPRSICRPLTQSALEPNQPFIVFHHLVYHGSFEHNWLEAKSISSFMHLA